MEKIIKNYQHTLSDRIKNEIDFADEITLSREEFKTWLKGLLTTKQQRFEQANKLKETYGN